MQKLHAAADAETLTNRAAQLVAAGRTGAARSLLAAARRLAPGSIGVADIGARLALRLNAPDEAALEIDQAIEAAPEHPGLRKRRAELRRQAGDIEGAARDAAEAVVLDRSDSVAKALLGVLLLELGRTADAVACLAEASNAEPGNPGFAAGLAAAQEVADDPDAALATLLRCVDAAPGRIDPRNAAMLLCVRRRDFRQVVRLAEDARRTGIADACAFGLLGHALSSLGQHVEAADAYAEALKLGPNDPYVRHLVAAAGIMPSATRAPAEYLRAVFDGYAERFEQHLISLGYRMPGLFRAVLRQHPRIAAGERVGPVLDLGCGTGLVALAIADLPVGPLTGVDIAPQMLAQAAAKGLYAELREADVMEVLGGGKSKPLPPAAGEACPRALDPGVEARSDEGEGRGAPAFVRHAPHPALRADLSRHAGEVYYPLILAADVFCYFGALEEIFAAVHASLTPGGWLVCSVEELLPDRDGVVPGDTNGNWALQRQGRYAHSPGYIRDTATAAGFQVLRLDREAVRLEADAPVAGLLIVLQRVRHDG
jgi:predicted TPR repeat methyltransferase